MPIKPQQIHSGPVFTRFLTIDFVSISTHLHGHGFWAVCVVNSFQKNPAYSQDELNYLVDHKHFIVFPLPEDGSAEHHENLTLEQYSQKIALYLSCLTNIN